jgi:hypothetical protein
MTSKRKENAMDDRDRMVEGLAALMEIVGGGDWRRDSEATRNQARLYCEGVRDGRIADVVFLAATLARMIGRD